MGIERKTLGIKMGFGNIWNSHPKKYGQGSRCCRACSNGHGLIRKYGLNMCRQCFHQYAKDIGFKKMDDDGDDATMVTKGDGDSDYIFPSRAPIKKSTLARASSMLPKSILSLVFSSLEKKS